MLVATEWGCANCHLKVGEEITFKAVHAPSCWIKTRRNEQGILEMEFGCKDSEERLIYIPDYCPKCGKKNESVKSEYMIDDWHLDNEERKS